MQRVAQEFNKLLAADSLQNLRGVPDPSTTD
jgi:hypothetical protein